MMQNAQEEAGKWMLADTTVTSKFAEIDSSMSKIIAEMTKLKKEATASEAKADQGDNYKKGILEYKVVSNLGRLKDDRKEYRVWSDKLKNAIDQVSTDTRLVLESIEVTYWGKGEEIEWSE